MKRISPLLLIMFACSAILLAFGGSKVAAGINPFQNVCDTAEAKNSDVCKKRDPNKNPLTGPDGLIFKGIRILSIIIGVAAVLIIIYSGFELVTSGGDANKVAKSRQAILFAVIGLLTAVVAQAVISLVLSGLS